ncbi:hypothetical protein FIBSPDRAFT_850999 [Athelia psychrophila]|uniref:Uncharacterized protein n=1 Tax=Athelia psychrophila TaxID=1759441 RepID=A0A166SUF7_9AGAM|nr:hypothetical protein FIBSPDRAFT_850999 [Fibularhizoctonia sp. CBS 109695]
MLREKHHPVSPLLDPAGWEHAEEQHTKNVVLLMAMTPLASSPDQQACLSKIVHQLPKLYPRLFVYQLARSAFHNTRVPIFLDEYGDSAVCLAMEEKIRDDLLSCQDLPLDWKHQPEIVATIDAIVRIDNVGAAVQRMLTTAGTLG